MPGRDGRSCKGDLPDVNREIFFAEGLDTVSENQRAQGTPDARCTRGLACNLHKRNAHEHTGSAEAIRHSLRNGFTAYNALFPVNGLSCHRCAANKSATRDASIAASEPRAFAVRVSAVRQRHISVHRISTHVRDDRERPSCRVRRTERNH